MDLNEEAFEAVRRWWRARIQKDRGTLERMEATEHAELRASGQPPPTGQAPLPEEEVSITDWDVFEPVTKLFDETVVCSYRFRMSGKRGRRNFTLVGRATDVLSKIGEGWTYLSHHGVLEEQSKQ